MRMRELAEMARLTCLVRERLRITFISDWNHSFFLAKRKKKKSEIGVLSV